LHAWCVDKLCNVIDVTWKDAEQSYYFGVPFRSDFLGRTIANEFDGYVMPFTEYACTLTKTAVRRVIPKLNVAKSKTGG
jgi:hypothetical protein